MIEADEKEISPAQSVEVSGIGRGLCRIRLKLDRANPVRRAETIAHVAVLHGWETRI
jgi:hypothetical protein